MQDENIYNDYQKMYELQNDIKSIEIELEKKIKEWEMYYDKIE